MDDAAWERFTPLWSDIDPNDEFYVRKPLLAHYTSVASIERILRSNELWFANPLYMNDREEVAFGIEEGTAAVRRSAEIQRACGARDRHTTFLQAYEQCYWQFAQDHVIDTYVFCMSEHNKDDNDGLLSMWRGYGGNGSGVALVIDTGLLNFVDMSSFILARVHYGTGPERRSWLENKAQQFAQLLSAASLQAGQLHVAASALFERIKVFALFTKHRGFDEEREWRIVYMPNRDTGALLKPHFGYTIGPRGVEPRLKLRIAHIPGVTPPELSLDRITNRIILGPTASSSLALRAFSRLLEESMHPNLQACLRASGIPFRDRP